MEYSPEKFNGLVGSIIANLQALGTKTVAIGVPSSKAARKGDAEMNNATLAFIHDRGAPDVNIPARPFLEPGIDRARPEVLEILKKAALQAVDVREKKPDVTGVLNRVGTIAASEVRKVWDDNDWEPLAESTIRAKVSAALKKGGRGPMSPLEREKATKGQAQHGMMLSQEPQILVDTGALRQSITYVIEDADAYS